MNRVDRNASRGLALSVVAMLVTTALIVFSQQLGEKAVAKLGPQPVELKPLAKYRGEHGYTAKERRDLAEVIANMDTSEDYVSVLERALW